MLRLDAVELARLLVGHDQIAVAIDNDLSQLAAFENRVPQRRIIPKQVVMISVDVLNEDRRTIARIDFHCLGEDPMFQIDGHI